MNFIKINGQSYDGDKLTFEDFKSLAGIGATKEKFEKLTGQKAKPQEKVIVPEIEKEVSEVIEKEIIEIPEKEIVKPPAKTESKPIPKKKTGK